MLAVMLARVPISPGMHFLEGMVMVVQSSAAVSHWVSEQGAGSQPLLQILECFSVLIFLTFSEIDQGRLTLLMIQYLHLIHTQLLFQCPAEALAQTQYRCRVGWTFRDCCLHR